MGEKLDNTVTSDVFEDPRVSEIWLDVSEITDDPTVAKDVINYLAVSLWNLPWDTWTRLHEQAAAR